MSKKRDGDNDIQRGTLPTANVAVGNPVTEDDGGGQSLSDAFARLILIMDAVAAGQGRQALALCILRDDAPGETVDRTFYDDVRQIMEKHRVGSMAATTCSVKDMREVTLTPVHARADGRTDN